MGTEKKATQKSECERMITIKIPRIEGKEDTVYVSCGDRSWRIKRGVYVQIPECAYDILRNSEIAEEAQIAYSDSVEN